MNWGVKMSEEISKLNPINALAVNQNDMSQAFVFCAIASKEGFAGSVNIKDINNSLHTYLCNAFVALKTTKIYNPEVNVGIITNASVDPKTVALFESEGIRIYCAPFDDFLFPKENKWSLAFFKLSSYNWAIRNLEYNYYIQLDCDVVCNGDLSDLIEESKRSVVMLSGPFTFSHPVRTRFLKAYKLLYEDEQAIVKYGSGLICGSKDKLLPFFDCCLNLYEKIKEKNYCNDNLLGDEFITSIAAIKSGVPIVDGNPYMCVYWTHRFYLVSTNYYYDKMVFLHLPAEKELGMMLLYKYYTKHKKFPDQKKIYSLLNLPSKRFPVVRIFINWLKNKITK